MSSYDSVSTFSTSLLDQVAIDGGVYLLPVNNAMYGIFYNKTMMEEHGWEVPADFAELEALCAEIEEAGLIPGVLATELADSGDELGMMPFISRNGRKNLYMYNPSSYIGISRRLAEPGDERKLENAVKLLSLLFSQEGQSVMVTEQTPCVLSVLGSEELSEDALIYDAQQALWDGWAFPIITASRPYRSTIRCCSF